mmetsp:Transcript_27004/g.67869  ORF Transcript_27004/g.67869 Transcript_27004/m.67869 type:complete len:1284 (+) Transcript_27004:235-4086(+)
MADTVVESVVVKEVDKFEVPLPEGGDQTAPFSLGSVYMADTDLVACSPVDGSVHVWNRLSKEYTRFELGFKRMVACGDYLVIANADHAIVAWDLKSQRVRYEGKCHKKWVTNMKVSEPLRQLFSSSADHSVRCWDVDMLLRSQSMLSEVDHSASDVKPLECLLTLSAHTDVVTCLALSEDGRRLFSGSADKSIIEWDPTQDRKLRTFTGHSNWIVMLEAIGSHLVSGARDQTVMMWDASEKGTAAPLATFALDGVPTTLALHPKYVFVATSAAAIEQWSFKKKKRVALLEGHTDKVRAVRVMGNEVFTAAQDRSVRRWDVKAHTSKEVFRGHTKAVNAMFLHRDALYTASDDGTVRKWPFFNEADLKIEWERDEEHGHRVVRSATFYSLVLHAIRTTPAEDDTILSGKPDGFPHEFVRVYRSFKAPSVFTKQRGDGTGADMGFLLIHMLIWSYCQLFASADVRKKWAGDTSNSINLAGWSAFWEQDPYVSEHAGDARVLQMRVMNFLRTFLLESADVFHDPSLLGPVDDLLEMLDGMQTDAEMQWHTGNSFGSPGAHGMKTLKPVRDTLRERRLTMPDPPEDRASRNSDTLNLASLKADTLAHQLSVLDYSILKNVPHARFLGASWHRGVRNLLRDAIDFFHRLSSKVAMSVLQIGITKDRAKLITALIQTASKLYASHNYNSLTAILTGLCQPSVVRLHETWAAVSAKHVDTFISLVQVMDPTQNYRNYHQENTTSSTIPFIGALLSELSFLDANEPTVVHGRMNWRKARKIGQLLVELDRGLHKAPDHKRRPELYNALWNVCPSLPQPDALMRMSLAAESSQSDSLLQRRLRVATQNLCRPRLHGHENFSYVGTELTSRDWKLIMTGAPLDELASGVVLITQGKYNDNLYRVKRGTVRVQIKGADGKQVVVAKLGAGTVLGEMSVLTYGGKGSATVVTDTDCQIHRIEIPLLYKIFGSEPDLAARFMHYLARKLAMQLDAKHTKPSSSSSSSSSSSGLPPPGVSTDDDQDSSFQAMFGLHQDEVIVKEYEVAVKSGAFKQTGRLYVTHSHVCYHGKAFGRKVKEVIPVQRIEAVSAEKGKLLLRIAGSSSLKFHMKVAKAEEAASIIAGIVENKKTSSDGQATSRSSEMAATRADMDKFVLLLDDWSLLLNGAVSTIYRKDDPVIREGAKQTRIFQLGSNGSVRIEKMIDDKCVVLGTMGPRETFGEISLLRGESSVASASVIADADDVEVYSIDGWYIQALLDRVPTLGAKFFNYLCQVLSDRLRAREAASKPSKPSKAK